MLGDGSDHIFERLLLRDGRLVTVTANDGARGQAHCLVVCVALPLCLLHGLAQALRGFVLRLLLALVNLRLAALRHLTRGSLGGRGRCVVVLLTIFLRDTLLVGLLRSDLERVLVS